MPLLTHSTTIEFMIVRCCHQHKIKETKQPKKTARRNNEEKSLFLLLSLIAALPPGCGSSDTAMVWPRSETGPGNGGLSHRHSRAPHHGPRATAAPTAALSPAFAVSISPQRLHFAPRHPGCSPRAPGKLRPKHDICWLGSYHSQSDPQLAA